METKKEEICFGSTIIQGKYILEGGRWSSTGLNMYFPFQSKDGIRRRAKTQRLHMKEETLKHDTHKYFFKEESYHFTEPK